MDIWWLDYELNKTLFFLIDEELTMAHDPVHVEAMKLLPDMKQDERERLADTLDSIYLNEESYNR